MQNQITRPIWSKQNEMVYFSVLHVMLFKFKWFQCFLMLES